MSGLAACSTASGTPNDKPLVSGQSTCSGTAQPSRGTRIRDPIANESSVPFVPLVHVHELEAGGVVMSDDDVKVTAVPVDHPPEKDASSERTSPPCSGTFF